MTDDLIGPPTLGDQEIVDDRIGRHAPRARMDDWWTALGGTRAPTRASLCRRSGVTEKGGRSHKLLDAKYVLMDEPAERTADEDLWRRIACRPGSPESTANPCHKPRSVGRPAASGLCEARRSAEGGATVGRLPPLRAKSAPGPAEVSSPRTTSAELESN